ncbi:protein of unknown function [Pseudomonas mediterranea]
MNGARQRTKVPLARGTLAGSLKSLFIDSSTLLFIFCAASRASLLVGLVTLTTHARLKTQQLAMFSYCAFADFSATVAFKSLNPTRLPSNDRCALSICVFGAYYSRRARV